MSLIVYDALLLRFFFFFNDTATTEIYTLSLHDALPISNDAGRLGNGDGRTAFAGLIHRQTKPGAWFQSRSEEHTSELQSQSNLVCRLLLEKKKIKKSHKIHEEDVVLY